MKKKIAFITGEFPALSETFVLHQMIGLYNRNIKFDIYATNPREEKKVNDDIYKYDLLSKTKYLYKTNSHLHKILATLTALFNIKNIQSMKYKLKCLNLFKYKTIDAAKLLIWIDLLNKEYDLFYCHFGTNAYYIAELKKIGYIKGEIITVFHGKDVCLGLDGHVNLKSVFQYGKLMLPISDYWGEKLSELGCPKNKIRVLRLGVKINGEASNEFKKLDNTCTSIVSVGRLVEKKGFEYSIKAVKNLIDKNENLQYLIIGDGPNFKSLQSLIGEEPKYKNRIKLLGLMKHDDVIEFISRSDVFVLSSVIATNGDMEGIPVVLMEAALKRTPIISTYHSGIPELVIDNYTGLLTVEKDVKGIENAIKGVLNNEVLKNQLIENAYKHVNKEFNFEVQIKKLVDIIEND